MQTSSMNTVRLPQLVWGETGTFEITFPRTWHVELCHMAGYDRSALSFEHLREAIIHPVGTPPISVSARGKQEICVLFDDMSRPTRVAQLIPHVLKELEDAGIQDGQIRFICALGCHGTLTRQDFAKKLGDDVVSRFPVFNHNVIGNCTYVGTTSFGTPLNINNEVVQCDYKIALGSIVPHGFAGFGGGAKIILPGVASFETISAMHHMKLPAGGHASTELRGMGCVQGNLMRQNIEEAATMVGLDFKIDAIVNGRGETVSVYAGEPGTTFNSALAEAQQHYLTPRARDCDIVVTNTFAKANEGEGGVITGFPSIKSAGGDLVLIANAPEGHVAHYLFGNWGSLGSDGLRLRVQVPSHVERIIIFNEHKDLTATGYFAPREKVLVLDKWSDVLGALRERHGDRAKVGVYSSAEIQYCDESRSQSSGDR